METKETGTKKKNLELFRNVFSKKALITLEQVNTTEWLKKKIRILISKI